MPHEVEEVFMEEKKEKRKKYRTKLISIVKCFSHIYIPYLCIKSYTKSHKFLRGSINR